MLRLYCTKATKINFVKKNFGANFDLKLTDKNVRQPFKRLLVCAKATFLHNSDVFDKLIKFAGAFTQKLCNLFFFSVKQKIFQKRL